ncbi:hypothetical protein MmiAt1_11110 [Methanimicrococcus sp. At1]|uniref:Uncharacterized protein n=1 Tax=Methanimicrococcus hacksteinii TaxID=3028293 RepID=A0ABU3VQ45_9EURY|nr:hypothetical protein [Methanimicrococcus sp. At1]MDV0445528.1 hypothetical protein [Methanimicrococcus sp. At1]
MENKDEFAGIYMATGTLIGDTLSVYKKDGTVMFFASGYGMLIAANAGTYRLENDSLIATVIPLIRTGDGVNELVGTLEDYLGENERIFHDNSGTRVDSYYEYLISRDVSFFEDYDFSKLDGKTEVEKVNFGKNGNDAYLGENGTLQGVLADFVTECFNQNKEDVKEKSKQDKEKLKAEAAEKRNESSGEFVSVFGSGPIGSSATECGSTDNEPPGNEDGKKKDSIEDDSKVEISEAQIIGGAATAGAAIAAYFKKKSGLKSFTGGSFAYCFGLSMNFYIKELSSDQDFPMFFLAKDGKITNILVGARDNQKSRYDDWTGIFNSLKASGAEMKYFCFLEGCSPNFPAEELFNSIFAGATYGNIGQIPPDEPFKIESIHACLDIFRGVKKHLIDNKTIESCLESLSGQFKELAPDCEIGAV